MLWLLSHNREKVISQGLNDDEVSILLVSTINHQLSSAESAIRSGCQDDEHPHSECAVDAGLPLANSRTELESVGVTRHRPAAACLAAKRPAQAGLSRTTGDAGVVYSFRLAIPATPNKPAIISAHAPGSGTAVGVCTRSNV